MSDLKVIILFGVNGHKEQSVSVGRSNIGKWVSVERIELDQLIVDLTEARSTLDSLSAEKLKKGP